MTSADPTLAVPPDSSVGSRTVSISLDDLEAICSGWDRAEECADRAHERCDAWESHPIRGLPQVAAYRAAARRDRTAMPELWGDALDARLLRDDHDLDANGNVFPEADLPRLIAESTLSDTAKDLIDIADDSPDVDRAMRCALAVLMLSIRYSTSDHTYTAELRQSLAALRLAAAVARKAGNVARADLLDALAARLAAAVTADAPAPSATHHPECRTLAPPGRRATAHPHLAQAPPVARVSAAA